MQYWLTLKSDRLPFFISWKSSIVAACVPLLFLLTACGGNASSSLIPQAQTPATQPAESSSTPSSSSTTQSSGTQSSDSGSGSSQSSGSSSPAPAPPSGPPGVPAGAQTTSAIQTLSGWDWCTAKLNGKPCASGLGNATSSMTPQQSTPSLSGKSSLFTLGGPTQYSNALWWKSLGKNDDPTHFAYDVYFYLTDPGAPEALEFDVNQSMGGARYTWGTECSYRDTAHWDIWNPEAEHWETTSVPCPPVSAKEWHHLTWQIERVNGQVHYISVTLDGKVGTVDKYYDPQQHYAGSDLNVAFQMDGDYRQDPYSVWLDNVSLSAW
jgi:hypothetical protein